MSETSSPSTRRRFLIGTAALPIIAVVPVVAGRLLDDGVGKREGLVPRLTSNDGRFQALADPLPPGGSMYEPGGRSRSTIAVRDQLTDITSTMSIDRNLEPEAFSPDGQTLFAIDHLPADDPVAYRVSTIDVASGAVTQTLGPSKIDLGEEMRGSGRQQVWSPRGDQLYTLYVRQLDNAAFVHVLDVVNDWALCVDLPAGVGLGPADSTAIMVSADGLGITVVDHSLNRRVEVTRLPDLAGTTGRFKSSGLLAARAS